MNIVPPLHFMVTDETGHTVAIEPHNGLLIVKDNYVHTLTNEPKLDWHLSNLKITLFNATEINQSINR